MTWPSACPKCWSSNSAFYRAFGVEYMPRITLPDCINRECPDTEHMHHRCFQCGYIITTPCKDAGEEPGK